jgi:hypothetical protein
MSDLVKIPERPATILATLHESTRTVIERVYLAFAMDDWISKLVIAHQERIAQQDAEIERLKRERDSSRKASQQFMRQWHRELATVETLKGLLRGWQMVCRAVQIGAEIPRTIEDLSLRTDQQLQPKGEQG